MESVISKLSDVGYKIGAVAKITGIGTETLRAWERRYKAVEPQRSPSGGRVYTREEVTKLLLLKSLVDNGHAISSVANFNLEQLRASWNEVRQQREENMEMSDSALKSEQVRRPDQRNCRVGLIGDSFPLRVTDGLEDFKNIELMGTFDTLSDWVAHNTEIEPHVVIVEAPTVNADTREYVNQVLQTTRAWHVIVLFGFANQEAVTSLQDSHITAIRHSVDIYELARLCISRSGGDAKNLRTYSDATLSIEQSIPARRFSNKQLSQLAGLSKTIRCECPQHVTQIIKSLVAFEIYSGECEKDNQGEAPLHAYLHGTTAQVRSIMEDALSHIMRHENISIS